MIFDGSLYHGMANSLGVVNNTCLIQNFRIDGG